MVRKKYVNGVFSEKTHYVFEGLEPIFEKRINANNANDFKIRSYVYAGAHLIARVDGKIGEQSHFDASGAFVSGKPVYFYHTDHLGSVKAVTNFDFVFENNEYVNKSHKVWSADYLPFGQQHGKEKIDPTFEEDDIGFTGKGYDAEIGLYYFNARWYDADTGRFISEDPVGDPNNPNLYTYCRNNPLNITDPTGLETMTTGNGGTYDTVTGVYTPPSSVPVGATPTDDGGYTTSFEGDKFTRKGDGSYSYDYSYSETDSNGLTTTHRGSLTMDSDYDNFSGCIELEFSKAGHGGKVIFYFFIENNGIFEVAYDVIDVNGNIIDGSIVTDITLIGLRGWGTGLQTTGVTGAGTLTVKEGENRDIYDDMIILVNPRGDIGVFDRCNFESTNYVGKWSDSADALDGVGGDIADGVYTFHYGWHKNSYAAFWVNNNYDVDSMTQNPHHNNEFLLGGVHIHKGGRSWSYSTGCITIYEQDWNAFISYFKKNKGMSETVTVWTIFGPRRETRDLMDGNNRRGTLNGKVAGTLSINTI